MMNSVALAVLLTVLVSITDVESVQLRLNYYGSTYHSYGRLEMYYSYQWIPFSIDGFDMHEADLACRWMGYGYASKYATVQALGYSQATTSYIVYNLRCSSTYTSFSSCRYSRSSSSYYRYNKNVGLQCSNTRSSLRLLSSSGSLASSTGRLQIYINNTWGTVCNTNFGSREARLACGQLGYSGYSNYQSASYSYQYSLYSFSGPIWYGLSYCTYSSTDLRNCTSSTGSSYCSHSQDIILSCYGSTSPPYPYYTDAPTSSGGNLRLVSNGYSSYPSRGRLEIYYYNYGYSWVPFCSQYFNKYDADLACKKLGFRRASRYGSVGSLGYSQSNGLYSIRSNCYSYSSGFDSCSKYIVYSCSHSNDVALDCVNYESPTISPYQSSGDLRLISHGHTSGYLSGGRLEVYYYNSSYVYSWMPFCYYGFSSHAADLACKQLGYTRATAYSRVGRLGYDQSTSSNSITSVSCYSASLLRSCYFDAYSSCSHSDDVAVSCIYEDSTTSAGLIAGLTVGALVLCSTLFIGVTLCAVVVVMYRKKQVSQPRTVNVVQDAPEVSYRMSDLAAQENNEVPVAATQFPPNQFTPIVLQSSDGHAQNVGDTEHIDKREAFGDDTKDDIKDVYPLDEDDNEDDDQKPLIS